MPSRHLVRWTTIRGTARADQAPIYVDTDDNRVRIVPAGSGTTEVTLQEANGASLTSVLTAAATLTANDSGKTYFLNLAGGFTVTLPAVAAGLNFKFIVITAPTTAYVISTATNDNIFGHVLTSAVTAVADQDSETSGGADVLNFVANTALVGDKAEFWCDGTNWFAVGSCAAAGGITFTG